MEKTKAERIYQLAESTRTAIVNAQNGPDAVIGDIWARSLKRAWDYGYPGNMSEWVKFVRSRGRYKPTN